MKDNELQLIKEELDRALANTRLGKVFPLSRFELVIDMDGSHQRYLFISIEPAAPRIYLIKRRMKELERASVNPSPFVLLIKKHLSGAVFTGTEKLTNERVLFLHFDHVDELGNARNLSLAAQLTGRSANLFLLDSNKTIIASGRETTGNGQEPGNSYSVPTRPFDAQVLPPESLPSIQLNGATLSETLDRQYLEKEHRKKLNSLAAAASAKIKTNIKNRQRLVEKLKDELERHGDSEKWKHLGDLLLANTATAKRTADGFTVIDYYDENIPEVSIAADVSDSPSEAAEKYFRKYSKARNAAVEIRKRLAVATDELDALHAQKTVVDNALNVGDLERLQELSGTPKVDQTARQVAKQAATDSAVKKFLSSDGFEILVGKKAKDNDYLTTRLARSLDTWMHAADYPGSHVIIRNQNNKEIPQRTLLEAAQLAAFYSKARGQTKAAVNYTLKKFVNKPKGSPPGLVNLSSFKTLLVEPVVNIKPI